MAHISPYIKFNGKSIEALTFYKAIFGGELDLTLVKDSPLAKTMPPEMADLLFHGALKSDAGVELMASDMQDPKEPTVAGNNISLGLTCDSSEQLQAWFAGLSDGGSVTWPAGEAEWGAIYGQCIDKYGLTWMLNYDKPK